MKKAQIVLSVISLLSIISGLFAFKSQQRFAGKYFCATKLAGPVFANKYTVVGGIVTLFCTMKANYYPVNTFKVIADM